MTYQVTVGLPVYNGEAYLEASIRSVLDQPGVELTLHISDNASTDATEDICRSWAERDPRIRYERLESNIGMIPNCRRVAAAATTEYFARISADDRMLPGFLRTCVDQLEADPAVALAMTGLADVDLDDPSAPPTLVHEDLGTDSPDPVARFRGLMGRHECLAQFGVYRTSVLQSVRPHSWILEGDRVLLVETALRGRIVTTRTVLYHRGQHQQRSMRISRATERLAVMFPERAGHIPFPTWALGFEIARAVHESPLPASQRMRCYASMGRWVRGNAENLSRNLVRGAIEYADKYGPAERRRPSGGPDGAGATTA